MQFVISYYRLQPWAYLVKGCLLNSLPTPCLLNKLPVRFCNVAAGLVALESPCLTSIPNPRCSPSPLCFSEWAIKWKLPFLYAPQSTHTSQSRKTIGFLIIRCLLLPPKNCVTHGKKKTNMCGALIQGSVQDNLDDFFSSKLRVTGFTPCYWSPWWDKRVAYDSHSKQPAFKQPLYFSSKAICKSLCTPSLPNPHRMWVCVSSQLDSLPL